MAKPQTPLRFPIKSDREFQRRLIAKLGILNERLLNIQAAMAVIADCIQVAPQKLGWTERR